MLINRKPSFINIKKRLFNLKEAGLNINLKPMVLSKLTINILNK